MSLLHAAHTVEARLEEALAAEGLSLAKQGVLTLLVEAGEPLPLSELAARQSCVRSNITQLVDRLEADGLVKRIADPTDRRSILAQLTQTGRDRQAAGAQRLDTVQATFAASVARADRAALQRALAGFQ
jgi:DNA-binding MarR family transcriptional regulator